MPKRSRELAIHKSPMGTDKQPVSYVEWVDPADLHANDYNPNRVAPAEMRLLKVSILEDGWTQPIVVQAEIGEIADGFHRWTLGNADKDVRAMTDGLVPVVYVESDPAQQKMTTIRHNRARGTHHAIRMADIVTALVESKLTVDEIMIRLGMDREEVVRLLDRGRHVQHTTEFSSAWRPKR